VSAGSDRLEQIIEAANHVAATIREDAEAQARRYVEDARRRSEALTSERIRWMSEASDALLEQGRTMIARTDQLVETLRDAADRIATATADVQSPRDRAVPASRERPQPAAADESRLAEVDARRASEEPRLLATRMAVAGSSPRQVEARLREVGVEDPVGLVDAIFSDT
jgi:hypothetical protein